MKANSNNPMWGGQFSAAPSDVMRQINASIDIDKRLFAHDIMGSIAHVQMLAVQGILTAKEAESIEKGLLQIRKEIEAGKFAFNDELEDIHMHIESRLKEIIGDVAGKLHTARSRNDQVATSFRLWLRDAIGVLDRHLQTLQAALIAQAEGHVETIMPGFTHLQIAQPITFAHHLLAYVEMFGRDRARLRDAQARLNESPLGAAALAGTPYPVDRHMTAAALGFSKPMANSLDAVSARDFVLEFLSDASICAVHLSRLAEEIILWSSPMFGFIHLSDAYSTGSSIMPQKRNPDAAELVRGKAGGVFGHLVAQLATMKALPLAYNKDMQEDKEAVFAAFDTLALCLAATAGMVQDMTVNKEAMRASAEKGYATATDLADWLVRALNIPFREAHHATGQIVRLALNQGRRLDQVPLADMQAIDKRITQEVFSVLSVEHSLASRESFGGTAPVRVREAIVTAKENYL